MPKGVEERSPGFLATASSALSALASSVYSAVTTALDQKDMVIRLRSDLDAIRQSSILI